MQIVVNRQYFLFNCTIGQVTVQFEDVPVLPIYVCDSLEPHAIDWSTEKKVVGKTAIPCGEYKVEYEYSQKFKKQMPFLKDVPFLKVLCFILATALAIQRAVFSLAITQEIMWV